MPGRSIQMALVAALLPLAAEAAPDLVPDVSQLATSGKLVIVNQGNKPAGASVATIVCQAQGAGSCAEAPGMAVYENAAYPNAVTIPVPVLAPGKSHSHTLSFWDDLDWAPGTYALHVKVDAGGSVAEDKEGNNQKIAHKTVLPDSVGSRPETVGGFTAGRAGGRAPIRPGGSGTIVAGLPDITKTELGFGIGGYTAWGGTAVIDQPHLVKATQSGPNKDMCLIGTGMYRTFNKGNVAAGSFVDILYINGAPVHTRHVASLGPKQRVNFENRDFLFKEGMNVIQVKMDANKSVSESDENNTFQVKAIVKVDCNGDGTIAGSGPQIKSPSVGSTPRPTPRRSSSQLSR